MSEPAKTGNIMFSPGACCCTIHGPCPGCHDYLSNYTNQDLPGIVLSQSPFLWALNQCDVYLHLNFDCRQTWDLTPYQNIIQQYPQYRCGYWRIAFPCDYDLYEPQDYFAGEVYRPYYSFYGQERKPHGCIDHDGNLVGLPDKIYFDTTRHSKIDDLFLCIAAPRVTTGGNVTPHHWPVTPGTSHDYKFGIRPNNGEDIFNMLNYINWARTRPQDWFNAVIRSLTPLIAYDTEVTKALREYEHPTASHLSNVWGAATPVPPLKLNPHLTKIGTDHSLRMIEIDKQRYMLPDEILQANEYLNIHYKGVYNLQPTDLSGHIVYAYGRDDRVYGSGADSLYCSGGSFTAAAFLFDWGVPSDYHRNFLLSPDFTEVGLGVERCYDSDKKVGRLVTTIILGTRNL